MPAPVPNDAQEDNMDTANLLIIIVTVLILGAGARYVALRRYEGSRRRPHTTQPAIRRASSRVSKLAA
jgi:hypothetical protein